MKNETHRLTAEDLADAAEWVRVVLTDAMHGRGEDAAQLHLLTGSKSEIERAISAAIVAGVERGRTFRAEDKARRGLA
jgi:hypothetical protein